MTFGQKLKKVMNERNMTQTQVCQLCDISPSSISQYLNGHNEPSQNRQRVIGRSLGLGEEYFFQFEAEPVHDPETTLSVDQVAKLMGKSREFVMTGLQDGVFPWGYAVKMGRWSYWISKVKFSELTGIEV